MPLYRTPSTLLVRCIKSVLFRSRNDIELLVIEAPFQSEYVYHENLITDQRIRYIRSSVASAPFQRNLGLEACQGEFVVFVDSDDYVNESFLEVGDSVLCDYPDADLYVFNHTGGEFNGYAYSRPDVLIADNRDAILEWFDTSSKRRPSFMEKSIWAKIYRRASIEKTNLRFDTKLLSTQDHFFNLRFVRTIGKVVCDPLFQAYHYEFSPTSMTRSLTVASPSRFQTLLDAWNSLFSDFPPTARDYRNKRYNLALIYLPTMLRDYFANPQNDVPEQELINGWKRELKKQDYRWAIHKMKLFECRSAKKAAFLFLLKAHFYGLLFKLYKKETLKKGRW